MASEILTASRRAWVNKERTALVPDGDSTAAILFARAGENIPKSRVSPFLNAASFFHGIEAQPVAKTRKAK